MELGGCRGEWRNASINSRGSSTWVRTTPLVPHDGDLPGGAWIWKSINYTGRNESPKKVLLTRARKWNAFNIILVARKLVFLPLLFSWRITLIPRKLLLNALSFPCFLCSLLFFTAPPSYFCKNKILIIGVIY